MMWKTTVVVEVPSLTYLSRWMMLGAPVSQTHDLDSGFLRPSPSDSTVVFSACVGAAISN